ncbi:MAG: DUF1330 domain-containing protein [Cyclobacteriaceae bacterium]|nr:DUF1330 domain-containing protein [Cytophagales bacterium]MBX2898171.1 DUF1330 domain-containing protein [Cyclobacteriaceae bacterium]
MPAYIIAEVSVHDAARYEDYKKLTPRSLQNYQGKFIVRGAQTECLEGDWNPQRIVVLEFPSVTLAKAWWASEEYAPAKDLRHRTAYTKMILVEGYLP